MRLLIALASVGISTCLLVLSSNLFAAHLVTDGTNQLLAFIALTITVMASATVSVGLLYWMGG